MGASSIKISLSHYCYFKCTDSYKGGATLTLEHINSDKKWDQSWEKTPLVIKLKSAEEEKSVNQKMQLLLFFNFFIYTS